MSFSNALRNAALAAAIVNLSYQSPVLGFSTFSKCNPKPTDSASYKTSYDTQLLGSVSKWNEEYESSDENECLNDMLFEPAKRKKKGSKEYKTDDGDALPFVVRVKTPDPYTPSTEMLKEAKKNSAVAKGPIGKTGSRKNSNLAGTHSTYANSIAASIYTRKKDGSLYKVLGQFELDKNTNCGDLVQVGEREFEVVTARAQFKYTGGKQFTMVRKILEVKEITRIAEEATLARLMDKETETASGRNFE